MAAVRRVAIVGGGIAGLASALALRQRGIEATVYERAPELREVGAGIALWPNATRALRQLGVLNAVVERSGRAESIWIVRPDGRPLVPFSTARPDAPSLCIHRASLIDALADALEPGAVRLGVAMSRVTADDHRAYLELANRDRVEADLIVGADGMRSQVREMCVESVQLRYRGYTAWRGVAPMPTSRLPCDAFEAWGDGHRFGLFPLDAGRAYWYALATRPEGERFASSSDEKTAVLDVVADWHPCMADAVDATPPEAIARHDVYDRPRARRWFAGRVALAGDAAHGMAPDIGQGGAQALEDGIALGDALSSPNELAVGLATYARARARRVVWVAAVSRWSGWLGQLSGRAGRVRNGMAAATPARWFEAGFTAPF